MKRMMAMGLLLALVLSLAPSAVAAGSPYYIRVNRATCTVTIYATDASGNPAQPLRAMVCSVGKPGRGTTPRGTYTLTGYRPQWCHMKDGSYGEYISQFKGNYLFHSVCYRKKDPATLMTEEYNDLGGPASLGCVRLQTGDAKWIYDNCPAGTKVNIFDGTAADDPLGRPEKLVGYIDPADPKAGWDPTSPHEGNPWPKALEEAAAAAAAAEEAARRAVTAYASPWAVRLDGREVELLCYARKDEADNLTHYVRLRDLAALLNGSAAQFEVGWDGAVTITTGAAYTPDGTEGAPPYSGDRPCEESAEPTAVNGQAVQLAAFVLRDDAGGGYTYYKLRDLGRTLDFNVGWSAEEGVFVETDKPYDSAD